MSKKRPWGTILKAFWQALRMTLRGETYTPPPPAYPALRAWAQQGETLVKAVFQEADANGLDEAARKQRVLTLDGRPISMQTILAAVQHNLSREYPSLLDSDLQHSVLTVIAFNMNDRYRLTQLADSLVDIPALHTSLMLLNAHLGAMPQSNERKVS